MKDYRGATVADLDPPRALSIHPETLLGEALEMSFEHGYSFLPVLDSNRRLLGYLTAEQLQKDATAGQDDCVDRHYYRFGKQRAYEPITPDTSLEDLAAFFQRGNEFAVVTDADRKFVLGVSTPEDLEKYEKSRPEV